MKYGTGVFEQLLPIFEASVCEHYKNDFLVHDRRMLEGTATPGDALPAADPSTGTNLVTVGVKDERDYLAACMRQVEPDKQEIHYVEVRGVRLSCDADRAREGPASGVRQADADDEGSKRPFRCRHRRCTSSGWRMTWSARRRCRHGTSVRRTGRWCTSVRAFRSGITGWHACT